MFPTRNGIELLEEKPIIKKFKNYLQTVPVNPEFEKRHKALYPGFPLSEITELIAKYHTRFKLNVLYVNWDKRLGKWYWLPDDYREKDKEERAPNLLKAAKNGYERFQWPVDS